jgi:hypothetical protein
MIVRPDPVLQDIKHKEWIYTSSKSFITYVYRCIEVLDYDIQLQGIERGTERVRDKFSYDKAEFYKKFVLNPNFVDSKLIRLKSILYRLKEFIDVPEIYNLLIEMEI